MMKKGSGKMSMENSNTTLIGEANNPNNYGGYQHYVEIEPTGKWNDNSGTYKRRFILEIEGCTRVKLKQGLASGSYFAEGTTRVSYDLVDNCGNVTVCSFDINVSNSGGIQHAYCDSESKGSSRGYIHKVSIAGKEIVSGDNQGYFHYEEGCVDLKKGQPFHLRISPGGLIYRDDIFYVIYIDYNNDGDFDDADEKVGKAKSTVNVAGDIKVPDDAVSGDTRMRIVASLMTYEEPCGEYYWGETEDYCLRILGDADDTARDDYTNKSQNHEVVELIDEKEDIGKIEDIEIYPNPASSFFEISKPSQVESLIIYGMDGRIHLTNSQTNNKVDISNVPSGLYLVQLRLHDGQTQMKKLVVE